MYVCMYLYVHKYLFIKYLQHYVTYYFCDQESCDFEI